MPNIAYGIICYIILLELKGKAMALIYYVWHTLYNDIIS